MAQASLETLLRHASLVTCWSHSPARRWLARKMYGRTKLDLLHLRELEAENTRLKKSVAQQVLDSEALKNLVSKKW